MIEFQVTVYMCSHCTRVHNAALDCLQHEQEEHGQTIGPSKPIVVSPGELTVQVRKEVVIHDLSESPPAPPIGTEPIVSSDLPPPFTFAEDPTPTAQSQSMLASPNRISSPPFAIVDDTVHHRRQSTRGQHAEQGPSRPPPFEIVASSIDTKMDTEFASDLSGLPEYQTSAGTWRCKTCGYKCMTRTLLSAHDRECHPNKLHGCNMCGTMFDSPAGLRRHMTRQHPSDGAVFQCGKCGKCFVRKDKKNQHERNCGDRN